MKLILTVRTENYQKFYMDPPSRGLEPHKRGNRFACENN